MSSLTAGLLVLALPSLTPAPASPARVRRGPIESRDEFLLAQPRLTLPAVAPDALERGRTRLRLVADWGNDFGYRRGRADGVRQPLYFVDGEHRSAALEVSRGVAERWTLHARLPVLWRGGGVLDGLIDAWHRLTGLPDSNRPQFPRDQLEVVLLDRSLRSIRWPSRQGAGLGGAEVGARWSAAARPSGWTGAVEARLQLPSGTGGYEGGGAQIGTQALAARTLGAAGDVYFGLGATAASRTGQDGLRYARARPQGFVAFEWRPWPAVSLIAQMTAAGRLVTNVEKFPGGELVLRMGAKVDVADGWRLEGGFTEGLKPVSATTDFGLLLGVERRF